MNFNSYYPSAYQPAYQQNQQQNNNSMIWVVGENGADSYLVAPNQTVQLWDSTAPVFYLKTADAMGRPSKRTFDYTERGIVSEARQIKAPGDFATKEDISVIKDEIEALRAKFADMEGGKKK